jgi:ATP-dependent Lon protease
MIGGVREKVLAAHRAGEKVVMIPERNLKDLVDVPKRARNDLKIIPVTHMDEVLGIALEAAKRRTGAPATAGERG